MSSGEKIDRLADIMCSLAPAITEEQRINILRAWCREFGGVEFGYWPKTCAADRDLRRQMQGRTPPAVERAAVAAYLDNKPVEAIVQEHGISRATLYRMIKR